MFDDHVRNGWDLLLLDFKGAFLHASHVFNNRYNSTNSSYVSVTSRLIIILQRR